MILSDVYQTSKKYGWVKSRFSKFPYPQKFYITDPWVAQLRLFSYLLSVLKGVS